VVLVGVQLDVVVAGVVVVVVIVVVVVEAQFDVREL